MSSGEFLSNFCHFEQRGCFYNLLYPCLCCTGGSKEGFRNLEVLDSTCNQVSSFSIFAILNSEDVSIIRSVRAYAVSGGSKEGLRNLDSTCNQMSSFSIAILNSEDVSIIRSVRTAAVPWF